MRFSKYLVLAEHEEPVIKSQLCESVSSVVAAPFILPNKAQRKMEQRKGTNVSGGESGTGNGWIIGRKPNETGSQWWISCGCFLDQLHTMSTQLMHIDVWWFIDILWLGHLRWCSHSVMLYCYCHTSLLLSFPPQSFHVPWVLHFQSWVTDVVGQGICSLSQGTLGTKQGKKEHPGWGANNLTHINKHTQSHTMDNLLEKTLLNHGENMHTPHIIAVWRWELNWQPQRHEAN